MANLKGLGRRDYNLIFRAGISPDFQYCESRNQLLLQRKSDFSRSQIVISSPYTAVRCPGAGLVDSRSNSLVLGVMSMTALNHFFF